jgi:hypothetical protein
VKPKSLKQLLERAQDLGCVITLTRNHHMKIVTPSGQIYFCAQTASDSRTERNIRAGLRQRGVDL